MSDDDLAFHVTLRERDLFTLPWVVGGGFRSLRKKAALVNTEKPGFGPEVV